MGTSPGVLFIVMLSKEEMIYIYMYLGHIEKKTNGRLAYGKNK